MKIKKKLFAAIAFIVMLGFMLPVSASEGTEPLQMNFIDDGTTLKIFTSASLDKKAELLIGGDKYEAEVQNGGIKINTLFLIDNSESTPENMRDEIKNAVSDYVSDMPENESVRIAMFDAKTKMISKGYTKDQSSVERDLSKLDFTGKSSVVYDALLDTCRGFDTGSDEYYRTILITDGFGRNEGVSFDYLKSSINESSRYHIDVVQVSETGRNSKKLSEIENMSSNTFMMFSEGSDLRSLKPGNISMLKARLPGKVTTGEMKAVTIKNGSSDIPLGSVLFPQVEKGDAERSNGEKENGMETWMLILLISAGAVIIIGSTIVVVILIVLKGKKLQCSVSVQVDKNDERDRNGTGIDVWQFPASGEFRVGRIMNPVSDNGRRLPDNHRAYCENATNEDISSIGRNAFSLTYDKKMKTLVVRNIANSAMFYVETDGRKDIIRSGQSAFIVRGSRILLGNYTTITIRNFVVSKI